MTSSSASSKGPGEGARLDARWAYAKARTRLSLPRSVLGRSTLGNVGLRLCQRPFPAPPSPVRRAGRGGSLRAASAHQSLLFQRSFPIGLSPSCACHTPDRPVRPQAQARFVWGRAGRAGPVTRALGAIWSGLARRSADPKVRISPSLRHTVSQCFNSVKQVTTSMVPSYTFCRYLHKGCKNYKLLRYEVQWELSIPVSWHLHAKSGDVSQAVLGDATTTVVPGRAVDAATKPPLPSRMLFLRPETNFKREQELLSSSSIIPVSQNTVRVVCPHYWYKITLQLQRKSILSKALKGWRFFSWYKPIFRLHGH